jgi:hypothetical protein
MSNPSPTLRLLEAASAARDYWMQKAHEAEGTPEEPAADAAFTAAQAALKAAGEAHRAARRAHGDNV